MAEWKYNNEFALPVLSNFRCISFPKEEKKVNAHKEMWEELKKEFRNLPFSVAVCTNESIKRLEKKWLKEEKKVKVKPKMSHEKFSKLPYLDVKVVKVKGKPKVIKPKCLHVGKAYPFSKTGDLVKCVECGEMFTLGQEDYRAKKGNWVNGENLDKIKFPCFCRYVHSKGIFKEKRVGMITANFFRGFYQFTLHYINKQGNVSGYLRYEKDIKRLITDNDIHILKGKIILFSEEE